MQGSSAVSLMLRPVLNRLVDAGPHTASSRRRARRLVSTDLWPDRLDRERRGGYRRYRRAGTMNRDQSKPKNAENLQSGCPPSSVPRNAPSGEPSMTGSGGDENDGVRRRNRGIYASAPGNALPVVFRALASFVRFAGRVDGFRASQAPRAAAGRRSRRQYGVLLQPQVIR